MGAADHRVGVTTGGILPASAPGALPAGLDRRALLGEVSRVCDVHLPHAATVLIAVSGGPDSTALAYLVSEVRSDLQLFVAHVRHGLRDDRADAAMAADHAAALGLGYTERSVTVRPQGVGVEAAARRARYQALRQLARQVGAGTIVVGHTADDQAETVLMNLARGSGLRGLSGMAEVRDMDGFTLLRPLLKLRRSDIRAYVSGEGLDAVRDPTNRDPDQRRVRTRDRVMPALASLSGGPGDPVAVLTRMADLARDDADALDAIAHMQVARLARRWGPARCVQIPELRALPTAVATRVVRGLLEEVRGGTDGLGAEAVTTALSLTPGQAAHVAGGVWVTCGGGWLAVRPGDLAPLGHRPLRLPGTTELPEINLCICTDLPWGAVAATPAGQRRLNLDILGAPTTVAAAYRQPPAPLGPLPPGARGASTGAWMVLPEGLTEGLAVRAWQPGDRFSLAQGRRKLQDLFTDQGVPRGARSLVPVVVDADDEPIWVPGVAARHIDGASPAGARLWLGSSALGVMDPGSAAI